jgi:hypothetical protein
MAASTLSICRITGSGSTKGPAGRPVLGPRASPRTRRGSGGTRLSSGIRPTPRVHMRRDPYGSDQHTSRSEATASPFVTTLPATNSPILLKRLPIVCCPILLHRGVTTLARGSIAWARTSGAQTAPPFRVPTAREPIPPRHPAEGNEARRSAAADAGSSGRPQDAARRHRCPCIWCSAPGLVGRAHVFPQLRMPAGPRPEPGPAFVHLLISVSEADWDT